MVDLNIRRSFAALKLFQDRIHSLFLSLSAHTPPFLIDLFKGLLELHVDMVVLLPFYLELLKDNRFNLFAIVRNILNFGPFLFDLCFKHTHFLLIQSGRLPQLLQSLFIQLDLVITTLPLLLYL